MNEENIQKCLTEIRKLLQVKMRNKPFLPVYPISKKPEKTNKFISELIDQQNEFRRLLQIKMRK